MLHTLAQIIERALSTIGRAVALLVLLMIALITIEMFARGVMGISFPWVQDLSNWLLTILIMIGGPYALLQGRFVRVDILFARLSPKQKAIVDTIFSTTLMSLFVWVLVAKGSDFFLSSYSMGERSATGAWDGPVWLAKLMIPLGGTLLAVAWLAHLIRSWHEAVALPLETTDSDSSTTLGM